MDSKKQYAIKHWLELTSDAAHEEVTVSLRDGPFQFGPWGEQLSILKFIFLESTAGLAPMSACEIAPASNEATITINWALQMDATAQGILFQRIRRTFERATAIIDQPSDRKKYRMGQEELMNLRNMICLWCQIRQFCSTRVANYADLDRAICTGNTKDHELQPVLDSRPAQFGVSMLPCAQKQAMEAIREQEEGASLEVEKERLAVRDARWAFFKNALQRDQDKLQMAQEAPSKLEALKHRKQVAWRLEQAKTGEKVIKSYKDKYFRCDLVTKPELAQQKINEYRSFVATEIILNWVSFLLQLSTLSFFNIS